VSTELAGSECEVSGVFIDTSPIKYHYWVIGDVNIFLSMCFNYASLYITRLIGARGHYNTQLLVPIWQLEPG